jgi:hypothetical protein
MSRKNHSKYLFLLVTLLSCSLTALAQSPMRSLGVMAGPERVFLRPVAEIIPELKGAAATRVNGRVGSALVFWGYRLSSGQAVNLFACAETDDSKSKCEYRIAMICPSGKGNMLKTLTESGDVVRRVCDAISQARVGDLHPGCNDSEVQNTLQVGLVSCPGS